MASVPLRPPFSCSVVTCESTISVPLPSSPACLSAENGMSPALPPLLISSTTALPFVIPLAATRMVSTLLSASYSAAALFSLMASTATNRISIPFIFGPTERTSMRASFSSTTFDNSAIPLCVIVRTSAVHAAVNIASRKRDESFNRSASSVPSVPPMTSIGPISSPSTTTENKAASLELVSVTSISILDGAPAVRSMMASTSTASARVSVGAESTAKAFCVMVRTCAVQPADNPLPVKLSSAFKIAVSEMPSSASVTSIGPTSTSSTFNPNLTAFAASTFTTSISTCGR